MKDRNILYSYKVKLFEFFSSVNGSDLSFTKTSFSSID